MNRTVKARLGGFARKAERGIAAVEFALVLPILFAMLVGMADISNLLLLNERVDRISFTVNDIITQQDSISNSDLDTIFLAAKQLMLPYDFTSKGVVIVSWIRKDSTTGVTKILWQYAGGGGLARSSKIGLAGQTPTLPAVLTLNAGDDVIVTEVYYAYTPLLVDAAIVSAKDLYHAAYFKPRLSSLSDSQT